MSNAQSVIYLFSMYGYVRPIIIHLGFKTSAFRECINRFVNSLNMHFRVDNPNNITLCDMKRSDKGIIFSISTNTHDKLSLYSLLTSKY